MPEVAFTADQSKSMVVQAVPGHNRWHPDVPAAASVRPGSDFRGVPRVDGLNTSGPSWTRSMTRIGACRNSRSASRVAGYRWVPQVEVAFTP
jgi:Acetamidase/Formamidase family